MKKLIHVMSFSVLLVVALAGCATPSLTSASYVRPEARQVQVVETATIVAVRSVTIEPRNNNGVGIGATVGATLGAAIGNRVGGGNGRVAATVLTASIGGVVGQRAEFAVAKVPGVEITYTKGDRTFAVVQEDDGSKYATGETVAVITNAGWPVVTRISKR